MDNMPHQGLSTLANTGDPVFDSLDLPQGLSGLFQTAEAPPAQMPQSYEMGGMVGPGGTPVRPGQQMMSSSLANGGDGGGQGGDIQSIKNSMQTNPQVAMQIRQTIQEGIQSGEITQEELSTMVNIAQTALQNPQMYPQLIQGAIQKGLLDEGDFPPDFESAKGFLVVIIAMGESTQQAPAQGGAPSAALQKPQGEYENGGALPQQSKNKDGSIAISAHEGEFVIPANVVRRKGTDFFEKMIAQANEADAGGGENGKA